MVAQAVPLCSWKLDRINRHAYERRGALRQFGTAKGWLERGEQYAIMWAADAARGTPILDLGVGGGRTAPLMCQISDVYCGIDYVPAMVGLARRRFPNFSFALMDARQLYFPNERFGLAAFSYNGIDSVDLVGQGKILHEVYRVLKPGGYFVFSALNRNAASEEGHWPDWRVFRDAGWSRGLARLILGGANRLRHSRMWRGDGEVAIGPLSACNFSLVTVFMSVQAQTQRLQAAGFVVAAIFTPDGRLLPEGGSEHDPAPWHHFVARKPS